MLETPKSLRYHIGIFGASNSGKSKLLNLLCEEEVSLVSDQEGTTTDPVYKNIEIDGVGASTLIDTAGSLDGTSLGQVRMDRTKRVLDEVDCGIYLLSGKKDDFILREIENRNLPCIYVRGYLSDGNEGYPAVIDLDKEAILSEIRKKFEERGKNPPIFKGLLEDGDQVFLLVMPQDQSAPKGRLILPQVQVIRELLDLGKTVISISSSELEIHLSLLKRDPDWIIVDSQIFEDVYKQKPEKTKLTSFSVLFARAKGDIDKLVEGARALERLGEDSRILISEACSHSPKEEDIGRVKIPLLLRKRYGENLRIDFSRGLLLPENLEEYDLVIFCGSCMFSHKQVQTRICQVDELGIPVTNYGLVIAYLNGILDKISI